MMPLGLWLIKIEWWSKLWCHFYNPQNDCNMFEEQAIGEVKKAID
jgi:hypothetical protein